MRRRLATATLVLAAVLGATARAQAACPPFDEDQTGLSLARAVEEGRITRDQAERMQRERPIPRFPVSLWPPSGPAPLNVGVIWSHRPSLTPRLIELDVDGDGVADVSDSREENLGHIYRRPGRFAATIRVHHADGSVARHASPVEVLTPQAFDAELQARWSTLKAALRRGDFPGAIECVNLFARQGAERPLRLLLRQGSTVEADLPPIRFLEVRAALAVYRTVRPRPRQTEPNEVHFSPDLDAMWRISSLFGQ